MKQPTLRLAQPADLESIMELERASFGASAWSTATMGAELASEHTHYVVAQAESGELVGFAGLLALKGAGDGDVQTIAVSEQWRGGGIGVTLLHALLEEAAARRVKQVFLEVRDDNPVAIKLYRSYGFEVIGTRPGYYQPENVDALVMRLTMPSQQQVPARTKTVEAQ